MVSPKEDIHTYKQTNKQPHCNQKHLQAKENKNVSTKVLGGSGGIETFLNF